MKRISFIVLVTLFIASGVKGGGYFSYGYSGYGRDHVRWSVYTQSLIPDDFYYSPYAHNYSHSGLVPYWVRYSPYAFGVNHPSGLVNDYALSPCSVYYYPQSYDYGSPRATPYLYYRAAYRSADECSGAKQTQAGYAAHVQARRDRLAERQQARQEDRTTASGGEQIVAAYLASKNVDFRMNRLLQIAGKTISADFELTERNAIVKYWDPVEILGLDQQAPHRKMAYENYLQSWKQFAGQYQAAGGKIYSIVSADSGEILAKLTDCSELSDEGTAYALAQGVRDAKR